MRWLSSAAAVQLLCLLDIATAISDYGFGGSNNLSPRREALLLYKRQDTPFCRAGYLQCPPEFGGGCCPEGRKCATRDCPALRPGAEDIPGAFTDTRPPETFTNPPPTPITARPTAAATQTSEPPETTEEATTEAPETTTSEAQTTSAATTTEAETETETEAPTTTGASTTGPQSTGTNTESQSSTATNAADAAETTTAPPVADGTLYTPMGISSGAIVGIVFAAITGAVIVGLVLWRAIIGIRHPKKKGKSRSAPPAPDVPGGAIGAAGAGSGGFFGGNRRIFGAIMKPFGKKSGPGAAEAMIPHNAGDETPMSQSGGAMAFGPHPVGSEGAPPYMQDRGSLDQDTSYNRGNYPGGGDLGYRGVESVDSFDSDTQGLFPRAGGFPNR